MTTLPLATWLQHTRLEGPLGTPPDPVMPNPPGVELTFTLVCAGVVAVGLGMMLTHWRRSGSPLGVLVLLGGMLACVQEPMVDTLGNMFIPPSHYTLFTTYGREMPWFAPFGYGLYFGIPMFFYIRAAHRGASRAHFQRLFAGSVVLELVFELIAVNGGFYVYYGEQSFRVFGLPIHWMTLNMAAAWVAAAAVYRSLPHLVGWRMAAVPVITLCAVTGSYYAQGWPIFSALHASTPSPVLSAVASLGTAALGIAIMQCMIRVLAGSVSGPAGARPGAERSSVTA